MDCLENVELFCYTGFGRKGVDFAQNLQGVGFLPKKNI